MVWMLIVVSNIGANNMFGSIVINKIVKPTFVLFYYKGFIFVLSAFWHLSFFFFIYIYRFISFDMSHMIQNKVLKLVKFE